jgi:TPR repeat protein
LGASYFLGEGVARKDEAQAVFWYRKSAEHGFASAQFALGLCCLEGRGCPKDEVQAAQWFMKAAIQGDAEANYRLARCYELGLGLKKDSERAIVIYIMSALGGHEYAQLYLGDYYIKMAGIAKQVEAYAYYALASETLEVAQERIAVLSKRMSEDALLLGKNRAAQLRDQSRQEIAEIKLKQEQAGK